MIMRETKDENRGRVEVDLQKLLSAYLKKWWLILICGIVLAGAAFYYTANHIDPQYRASVMIYVNNLKSDQQVESITGSNLAASQQLVNTYVNIIKSDRVLDKVADELDNEYTANGIRKIMTATQVEDTEIFEIHIAHKDPEEAARIVNTIAEVAPDEISGLVEGSSARIIDYAKVPADSFYPSYQKNVVLGGVIGILIAVVIVTIQFLMDVRLKDEEDLNQLFDLPVLGQIPVFVTVAAKGRSGHGGYGYDTGGAGAQSDDGKKR